MDRSVTDWSQNFGPVGRLKRTSNVHADQHPHIQPKYGAFMEASGSARVRPPRRPLIHLQRIYNFWLFHAIILSFWDTFWVIIYQFILFWALTYWASAECQFMFFVFFCFAQNSYQTDSKRDKNLRRFVLEYKWILEVGINARRCTRVPQASRTRPRGHVAPW